MGGWGRRVYLNICLPNLTSALSKQSTVASRGVALLCDGSPAVVPAVHCNGALNLYADTDPDRDLCTSHTHEGQREKER